MCFFSAKEVDRKVFWSILANTLASKDSERFRVDWEGKENSGGLGGEMPHANPCLFY